MILKLIICTIIIYLPILFYKEGVYSSDLYIVLDKIEMMKRDIQYYENQLYESKKKLVIYIKLRIFADKISSMQNDINSYSEKISELEKEYNEHLKLYTYLVSENKKEKWWKRMPYLYIKEYLEKL